MFGKAPDTRLQLTHLQGYFDYMRYQMDRIEAKLDRLEKLIRVAAPHPLGEPK